MKRFKFNPKQPPLWLIVIPALIAANLAYGLNNILGWIITLIFFLFVPGYLLLGTLSIGKLALGKIISLSIGLSLSLIVIIGLLLNSLYYIGLGRPLTTLNIFLAFDILSLALLWKIKNQPVKIIRPSILLTKEQLAVLFACSILPLLAIGGAIRLNNGASNILTLILMGSIAVLFVLLIARPNLRPLYPYAVFTIGLSILFCNSLRGWNITGHDIHHEFSVFESTLQRGLWVKGAGNGDPYNACLSITILPTILAKLTTIPAIYIYKVAFQVIFASMLPTLFYMFKRFASEQKAVLGVFVLMTFPTFTNDLPFLNRQEIAFIFIILLLFVNFMNIAYRAKMFLTVFFLISIILSHYSSSYVTLILLLVSPLFYFLLSRKNTGNDRVLFPMLRVRVILVALLLTFTWNAQITASTGNLQNTVRDTIKNLIGPDSKKDHFNYSLFTPPISQEPKRIFQTYVSQETGNISIVPLSLIPITNFGNTIFRTFNISDAKKLNFVFHAALAKILQLLVVLGTVLLFFQLRRKSTPHQRYLLALSCSCLLALALFTVVPQLAVDYDVTRLFQQSLMVLWLPSVLFAEKIFFFMKRYRMAGAAGLFAFLYLNLSGFLPQITGGFPPQLPLNNSGVYYDFFYTHNSDVIGTQWLGDNRKLGADIKFDSSAALPHLSFGYGVGLVKHISKGYLYVDRTDNSRGVYRSIINGEFVEYTNNSATGGKNLVYANQHAKIYYEKPRPYYEIIQQGL